MVLQGYCKKLGPGKTGPMRCAQRRERSPLTRGLLRNRAAELQGPILLATACDESNNGAEQRHDCDLLGHGFTPNFASLSSTIIILQTGIALAFGRSASCTHR